MKSSFKYDNTKKAFAVNGHPLLRLYSSVPLQSGGLRAGETVMVNSIASLPDVNIVIGQITCVVDAGMPVSKPYLVCTTVRDGDKYNFWLTNTDINDTPAFTATLAVLIA